LNGNAFAIVQEARVYVLLTGRLCRVGLLATAESILKGGCKLLQLREKEINSKDLVNRASELHLMCNAYNAVLICNDRVDVALTAKVAGVHVGQSDLSPLDVQRVAGYRLLVGRSTHSEEQAVAAVNVEHADYIGIGSMYETSTKPGRILAGLALAERVSALNLPVPVFAIGGIDASSIKELQRAGVRRIAVSSAVIAAEDPEYETKRLIDLMSEVEVKT